MGGFLRRSRATRARNVFALVLAVGVIGGLTQTATPTAGAAGSFTEVYAGRTRMICHLPASGNAQRVHGFDTGHSFVYNGKAYWSIGDSFIDGNNDGWANQPWGFRTGTIGTTTDLNAEDCIDNITYRTNTGTDVHPILEPNTARNECGIWPGAPFEADGRLMFFYTSVHIPKCDPEKQQTYQQALGQITKPDNRDLGPVRVVNGELTWGSPVKIDDYIYLFRFVNGGLQLARVSEIDIGTTAESAYSGWDGRNWEGDPDTGPPVVTGMHPGGVTVRYNEYLRRYMMVYSCGEKLTDVCARTATRSGTDPDALTAWNEPTSILQCPEYGCGHGFWHSGYKNPDHPERIYLSTAHPSFGGSRQYFVNLYSVDLSDQPAPATRQSAIAERDYDNPAKWTYAGYDASTPAALTTLTNATTSPAVNKVIKGTPPIPGFPAIGGNETIQGAAAPGVFGLGMYPSATKGAGRVWTAPNAGVVELSGEAWREAIKGDGSVAEIFIVGRDNTVTKLWQQKLLPKKQLGSARTIGRFHLEQVRVESGDRVVFGVRKGLAATKRAVNDTTFFLNSVTFDAA